ncbi:hypothetical protein [Rhodoferax sp.]|uniref:hypothetical protein n=1 Tax=Rhodoferax sp. TaxID=50421 RepID=UPI0028458493|nr:hypothetical protein [Rhodoferax sp.]MDR3368996.1 hypothetical protein [Rhodoferax sp.]
MQATPHGQIVYFAELLATVGIPDNWVKSCPLHYYASPNASRVRDGLGTLMLGVLSGSKRYAHLSWIRGDQVAAQALRLTKIVGEDSVRRALSATEPEGAQIGYNPHKPGRPSHTLHTYRVRICGWCRTCNCATAKCAT